ncbi:MAG TPA: UDP-N-acetylmuramoyl-L-alanyl-D-glutamate--2,6-diaminopimelate ligase [Anaerolineae bacterium]
MMQLRQLLADLPGLLALTGPSDLPITQITADSRQVTPGALFVAYRGTGVDGHRFVADAVARGAAAVAGENAAPADLAVPYVRVADGREALGWLFAAWYGHPSRAMRLAGVTGTDGKTTTCNLLYRILTAAGRRAGLISTINAVVGDQAFDTGLHTTTPDAPDVQRYLAQMRDAGSEIAVLETTSHGLAQRRVAGCAFDVAVVTNITHEHLDYHGSYEAYRAAKAMLFRSLATTPRKPGQAKTAVLNRDDSSYDFLAAIPAERTISYGLKPVAAAANGSTVILTAGSIAHRAGATEFHVSIAGPLPGYDADALAAGIDLRSALPGDFNVSNVLAASGAALALGLPIEAIGAGVAGLAAVPGRMERIDGSQDFLALVDFAHTPNALAQALAAAQGMAGPGGRVIAVFGCAGLRDREKRRLMGEVAARLAGYTVITAEDPRTEDLDAIIAETAAALLAAGKREGSDFVRVPDRQAAIGHAVAQARPGDVVIVCGKGHEQSMCFGATEYPWRDQDALRWALQRLHAGADAPSRPPFRLPTA